MIVSIGGVESSVAITLTDDWEWLSYDAAAVDGGSGWYEILLRVEGWNSEGPTTYVYLKSFSLAYYPEATLIDYDAVADRNQWQYWLGRNAWANDSHISAAQQTQALSGLYEWWKDHWQGP